MKCEACGRDVASDVHHLACVLPTIVKAEADRVEKIVEERNRYKEALEEIHEQVQNWLIKRVDLARLEAITRKVLGLSEEART